MDNRFLISDRSSEVEDSVFSSSGFSNPSDLEEEKKPKVSSNSDWSSKVEDSVFSSSGFFKHLRPGGGEELVRILRLTTDTKKPEAGPVRLCKSLMPPLDSPEK
jgi:hypothetical protein